MCTHAPATSPFSLPFLSEHFLRWLLFFLSLRRTRALPVGRLLAMA